MHKPDELKKFIEPGGENEGNAEPAAETTTTSAAGEAAGPTE